MDKGQKDTHTVKGPRVPQLVEVGVVRVAESQVVPRAHPEVSLEVEQAQPVSDALPIVQDEGGPGVGLGRFRLLGAENLFFFAIFCHEIMKQIRFFTTKNWFPIDSDPNIFWGSTLH